MLMPRTLMTLALITSFAACTTTPAPTPDPEPAEG